MLDRTFPPTDDDPTRSLSGMRIVAVDDHPDIRCLLGYQLSQRGAEVSTVGDSLIATNYIKRVASRPGAPAAIDAVILDIRMPGIDGVEVARQIRGAGFLGAIVALSADTNSLSCKRALRSGCDAFLVKPHTAEDLVDAIIVASASGLIEA